MRTISISGIFLMMFSLSVLLVTGCDNPNEKTEIIAPVEGSLLENGRVAPVTPEGAAELKEMMVNIFYVKKFREVFNMISEDMSAQKRTELEEDLEFIGEFDVIARSNVYEVTFPNRTRIYSRENDNVKNIEISHDIKLFVSPTGDPSAFRVKFEASEKPIIVTVNTEDGKSYDVLTVSYKSGKPFEALWHSDFQAFAQLVGSMQNFKIEAVIPEEFRSEFDDIDRFSMTIADVQNNIMLLPDENNLWSGAYDSILNNVYFELPQGVGGVSILKADFDQDIQKLNPVAYKAFFTQYFSLMDNVARDQKELNRSGDFLPFIKSYRTLLAEGFESANLSLTYSEIATKLNATPKRPQAVKNFTVKEVSFLVDISGLKEDRVALNAVYGLKGIDVGLSQFTNELNGEAPQELVPQNINLGFGVENVPVTAMFDKVIALMEAEPNMEASSAEKLILESQDEFINMMVAADTKFKIDDTYVGNDIWLLLANGSATLNPASQYKSQGEADIRFYGLDFLMQKLEERAKNPDTSPLAQSVIQQASMGLGMMQMFGQQKKDENDRDYRGYFLTLTPDGQMQMNGTDLTQMMGMAR